MYELTVLLDENGKEPLYEQIYCHIKAQIREGKIEAGERLPSTRLLAEHLGVSRSTTQLAYDQLIAEGYLLAAPRKGYFAAGAEGLYEIRTEKDNTFETKEPIDTCRYDFSARGIDADGFPAGRWKKLAREVLSEVDVELFTHGESQGELRLREAIRDYVYSARGVHCRPEQILIGAGSEYLLMLLHQIMGRNFVIAMENPTYMQAYRVFRGLGCSVVPVSMDEQGIDIGKLKESGASLAYVMPAHQFPTGRIMPLGRRMELIAWAAAGEDRYIIEDDYDSEFRYRGRPIPSLQGYDRNDRVIYLGTFSRSIAPGIRVSFLILPERLLERYHKLCGFYATTVSRIDQEILARFIHEGYYERHLNRMKGVYRAKHDLLLELLKPFQTRFTIRGENAGIHVLLEERESEECDRALSNDGEENTVDGQGVLLREARLVAEAQRAGVRVYGTSGYYLEGNGKNATVLLGFVRMSVEEIREAVRLLAEAWGID